MLFRLSAQMIGRTEFAQLCFQSRGRRLCKFLGTKESFYFTLQKSSTLTGLDWNNNMAAVSLFWDTNMATETSCDNALFNMN